jgi:sialate O-acetylesterase
MNRWMYAVLSVALMSLSFPVHAVVMLNSLLSDGAVLQQGREIPVWGTAKDGEKITVRFLGQEVSTVSRDGRWMVRLSPAKAGGPHTMIISGENRITIRGLLIGEVWLCSGQSNMAFKLHRVENPEETINSAADPWLRFFHVPRRAADDPGTDVGGNWGESTPQSASNFSAVAYFFGRDLRRSLDVPIGLIDASVGGTPAEAWTPHATLESSPELRTILEKHSEAVRAFEPEKASGKLKQARVRHQEAVQKAKADGKTPPRTPPALADPSVSAKRPSGLYNAMIAPLQPFAIAGAIWYQGEANAGRAAEYTPLFSAMIQSWRQAWGQGDFPFLFVQIAPHERMPPEIREAQLMAWSQVPRTAMIVTTDVGDESDIHPRAKEPVGARLALAARAIAYGENISYSGPICESVKQENSNLVLNFSHINGGLTASGGELRGFEVAGPTGTFMPAKARIDGDRVIVSSAAVPKPAAVRYGWENTPDVNLFNKAGLPASPFRMRVK